MASTFTVDSPTSTDLAVSDSAAQIVEMYARQAQYPEPHPTTTLPAISLRADTDSFWMIHLPTGAERKIAPRIAESVCNMMSSLVAKLVSSTSSNLRRFNTRDTGSGVYSCFSDANYELMIVAQLNQIKAFVFQNKSQKAKVAVYDTVCALLADKRFDDCDGIFARLPQTPLPSSVTLSFFMATANIPRDLLPSRNMAFRAAIRQAETEGNGEVLDAFLMCE